MPVLIEDKYFQVANHFVIIPVFESWTEYVKISVLYEEVIEGHFYSLE